ncbi:MAG: S-layer homology domain-containing protein [Thermoclostridium sp.]|nr:S-layer homology domain-containing protein [Thermoclostridium sp.]
MRRILVFLLVATIMLTAFPTIAVAQHEQKKSEFTDVNKDHWAYESVKAVVEAGIMERDAKGRFNPGEKVSRGEFAILMVKVLDLPLVNPQQGTFLDIPNTSKYYKYVETAKYYLTGYRTAQGDSFRPEEDSVREDIAVALVKALGYNPISNYKDILKGYEDIEEISPNLRFYVASVVENKIMIGTGSGGKKIFSPQLKLSRAEVAQLIYNMILVEKVTYDEGDKVTYDEELQPTVTPKPTQAPAPEKSFTPNVSVKVADNGLKVEWTKTPSSDFKYYKVVMSKSDSNPSYPDDGYIAVISDANQTSYTIKEGQGYNGGDVGNVTAGQKYYITITAVYNHSKYTGNVVRKSVPEAEDKNEGSYAPQVTVEASDGNLRVSWTKTPGENFTYYKVVMSVSDSSPSYPDDGYITYICDVNQTSYTISPGAGYSGGDVGTVTSGQEYYITITAVYGHGKYTGNVVHKQMP